MVLRVAMTVLALTLVFGGYYAWKEEQSAMISQLMAAYKPPPVTVSTTSVKSIPWQRTVSTTGSLRAEKSVMLAAHASGVITQVSFKSGQKVDSGDVLVKIDDVSEQSELKSTRAALALSETKLARLEELFKKKLVSQSDIDELRVEVQSGKSKIKGIEELIAHKSLRAPFSGVLGLRGIEVGGYLSEGTPIVSIQSDERMLLRFFVQERYLQFIKIGGKVEFHVDTYPAIKFSAQVVASDTALSKNNRALEVEAVVDNLNSRLVPGMFVSVKFPIGSAEPTVVVPEQAVVFSLYGDAVFVVEEKDGAKVVSRRTVKVGLRESGRVQILQGLKVGETVVIAGQGKLMDGAPVKVDNSVVPASGSGGA